MNGAEAERLKKRGVCPHTLQALPDAQQRIQPAAATAPGLALFPWVVD